MIQSGGAFTIVLPWPPASLSGHNTGHWRRKSTIVKQHRCYAWVETLKAKGSVPSDGDIPIRIEFYPPNRRGDRLNFPNRCKAYFDGIADALKTNDSRFLPSYHFGVVVPKGKVVVTIGGEQ